MRTRHKVLESAKDPPEQTLQNPNVVGVNEQLVLSVETEEGTPSTIVLVPLGFGGELMQTGEDEMVSIGMVEDDQAEEDGMVQVQVQDEDQGDLNQSREHEEGDSDERDINSEDANNSSDDHTSKIVGNRQIRQKRSKSSFVCHHCGYRAQSNPGLQNHILAIHEKIRPYLCDICGYSASAKANLDMHKAIKHLTKKTVNYACQTCEYKCTNDLHLKAHIQIVHVEKQTPFECGVCQYQCRKRCLVIKHMKVVHEKNKPFQCSQCSRAFSANCILQRHVEMVHDKVRPYGCDSCGYAFAERRFLMKHIRAVHEKSKPYHCTKCSYKSAMRDSLVRHTYNKHERKPRFKCRICSQGFRSKPEMADHYKEAHVTQFKPYSCDECNYSSDKKPRLERHILMEHTKGDHNKYRGLKCGVCYETFTQHLQLAEHTLKEHGQEPKSYVCDGNAVQKSRGRKRSRVTDIPRKLLSDDEPEDVVDDGSDEEWKNPSTVKGYRTASSRKVKRPKTFDDFVTPFLKYEKDDIEESRVANIEENEIDENLDPDDVMKETVKHELDHNLDQTGDNAEEEEDENDVEISEQQFENEDDEGIDFQGQDVFGDLQQLDEEEEELSSQEESNLTPKKVYKTTQQIASSAPRTIKFTVRTKGQTDDKPIELEIEIKDPGHSGLFGSNIEDRLQNDAQAVVNFLADGAVVDAIMSIEKKQPLEENEDDPMIRTIDTTNGAEDGPKKQPRNGGRRTFLCDMCGFACTSRQTLNTHYAYKHGNLRPQSMKCDQCDYRCDLTTQLNCHIQIVHKDGEIPFACNLCPQQYKTEGDLDRHLRAIHLDERPFVCSYCKHGFSKKSNLIKHNRMVHERLRPYQCDQCSWNFGEMRDLSSHIDAVHRKIRPFQCPQCEFKCARGTQLRVHLSNVHRVKPTFDCEVCGHKCATKAYLRSHIKSVHEVEVKRYQCGYCDFSSVTKLSVDRHMTTHTKEKRTGALAPLFCSFCGDTFPNHAKLAKHVRNDHGATAAVPKKVYECSSCPYKAGTHSLLKAHVRSVHENERRFKCELCDFTSFAKSAMRRHISAIHEKFKPYECDQCEFRTSYKESLDLHMASLHKTGELPKRVLSRKLKKASKFPETEDYMVTDVSNILSLVPTNVDDGVVVGVAPLEEDSVMHLGEVTIKVSDHDGVHEIQL